MARLIRRRWVLLVLAAVALAGVALALSWYLFVRDAADPASVEEAVASFCSGDQQTTGRLSMPTPEPGVYVYETSGSESVDALLGSTHTYRAQTTITVLPGSCGLLIRWDALADRTTTWDICPSPEGWAIDGYSEVHRFFGQTERTIYACDEGSRWAPTKKWAPGTTFARRCSTGDTTEDGSGRVVGVETLHVGETQVETIHVALSLLLSGRTRGAGTLDLWLTKGEGLIARLWLTNDNALGSAIGDVRYEEVARLELVSLDPQR